MHEKREAGPRLKQSVTFIEKQTGKSVKRLRLDEGREFGVRDLESWTKDKGIPVELTVSTCQRKYPGFCLSLSGISYPADLTSALPSGLSDQAHLATYIRSTYYHPIEPCIEGVHLSLPRESHIRLSRVIPRKLRFAHHAVLSGYLAFYLWLLHQAVYGGCMH